MRDSVLGIYTGGPGGLAPEQGVTGFPRKRHTGEHASEDRIRFGIQQEAINSCGHCAPLLEKAPYQPWVIGHDRGVELCHDALDLWHTKLGLAFR